MSDNPAPAGTPTSAAGETEVITTSSGAKFRVAKEFVENFRGFLKDFEAAGGKIDPGTSGGLSERPNNASYHPLGRAIDINQTDRNVIGSGLPGGIPEEEKLAHRWGLRAGSQFSNPDRGHYEVNNTAVALAALAAQGATDTEPPPDSELPMLQVGSSGEDVKTVQRIVFVDGIYGSMTKQGVMQFQKAHGLPADGVVGLMTWAALLGTAGGVEPNAGEWQMGITTTVFGGASDPQKSYYDGHLISDTEKVASVPAPLTGSRLIDVRKTGGGTIETVSVADLGPWLVDDPYWESGTRPVAEDMTAPLPRGPHKGKRSNGAGFDISPALAKALGIDGKGKVDWRFHQEPTEVTVSAPKPTEIPVPTPTAVIVPVKPAIESTQNWTQIAGVAASLITVLSSGKLNIPPETLVQVIVGIQALQAVVTFIIKNWFTTSVSPGSV